MLDGNAKEIFDALIQAIEEGKKDPTYWDRMASRIRERSPKGTVEEALGYTPEECDYE